jgi:hypothetical protein
LVPGAEGTNINGNQLDEWVDAVRSKAALIKRAAITDLYIGHLFAHSPNDPLDSAWPHEEIRRAIERLSSNDLEQGIQTERYNMRGVVTRGMFEGGDQERVLEAQYAHWAKVCASYPRTSAMLRMISSHWNLDAQREDERAEKNRLRYGG